MGARLSSNACSVEIQRGSITDVAVDVLVNSANGCLIHGSGVAATLSRASGELPADRRSHFHILIKSMGGLAGVEYRRVNKGAVGPLMPTNLQYDSARILFGRCGRPLEQGAVAFTHSGFLAVHPGVCWIVHVVGMTYDFAAPVDSATGKPPLVAVTPQILEKGIAEALRMVVDCGFGESVAIPIMCVRKGGLHFAQSYSAILRGVNSFQRSRRRHSIRRIIVVETGNTSETG